MSWLLDHEAVDVSRMTGVPWHYARVHQHGPLHPFIDLAALDWWDAWRVCWARIAGHHLTLASRRLSA